MANNPLTLSQFQTLLGNAIRTSRDTQNVWVQAEFSDLRVAGGHCYMELLEKDANGQTRAKIRAMIWSGTLGVLRRKFYEATGRDIASGMKVLVRGSATHHNVYGLSFTISDIDPSYTLGDMERLRREILERLSREGVINFNRQLTLPPAPRRIAVISAAGAAGYGDFINQLDANSEGFVFYPHLFPAVMQGERTAPSVMDALDKIEMTVDLWDAVVIIRGGGATTDLNGFDNYDLAHRVATFPLPVIVGIGHERDRTVLDEIACVRCKTPTAVAAFLIEALRSSYSHVTDMVTRIARYGTDALRGEHLRLSNFLQAVPALAGTRLMENKMKLSTLAQTIPGLVQNRIMRRRMALSDYASQLGRNVDRRIMEASAKVDTLATRTATAATAASERERRHLQRLDDMLRLLSPENTLKRGYSITRAAGRAVTDPSVLPPGTELETTLASGKILSVTK